MKKLLIILCLLLFVYVQVGYYVQSVTLRMVARIEFEQAVFSSLPDSCFQKFSWNEIMATAKWEEEGKEFWLKGMLYDVVRQKTTNGKTFLYCINDTSEEEIVEQQMKLTAANTEAATGNHNRQVKYTFPDIILTQTHEPPTHSLLKTALYPTFNSFNIVQNIEPLSPPPKCDLV